MKFRWRNKTEIGISNDRAIFSRELIEGEVRLFSTFERKLFESPVFSDNSSSVNVLESLVDRIRAPISISPITRGLDQEVGKTLDIESPFVYPSTEQNMILRYLKRYVKAVVTKGYKKAVLRP